MTDLLIIGQGPAGWSCAITARMRNLSVLVVAPKYGRSMLSAAHTIDNYPGMPGKSGEQILQSFRIQALSMGAEEKFGFVRTIQPMKDRFMALVDNDVVEARSVVIATGAGKPSVLPGEEELLGRGISYCATCDGMFYRGKKIAVLSESEQGVQEAAFLKSLNCDITYYSMKKHDYSNLNGIPVTEAQVTGFTKSETGITVLTQQGEQSYNGVFVFRSRLPSQMLLRNLTISEGGIAVDRNMLTNIPGVFAAGDCTGKPLQIAKAVGEGNIAAISAAQYLAK